MKKGQFVTAERTVIHIVYIIIFTIAFLMILTFMKAGITKKADYSYADAKSITKSLAGCMERDGAFSIANMKLCGKEESMYFYGAEIKIDDKTAYFNRLMQNNHPLCEAENTAYKCGYDVFYDGHNEKLEIRCVY